jgi:hypothetical protein
MRDFSTGLSNGMIVFSIYVTLIKLLLMFSTKSSMLLKWLFKDGNESKMLKSNSNILLKLRTRNSLLSKLANWFNKLFCIEVNCRSKYEDFGIFSNNWWLSKIFDWVSVMILDRKDLFGILEFK